MDVYVTESNEVGLFEFAQEFGYQALNVNDVRKFAVEAIHHVFNKSEVVF